jgi:hypothetical protein
MNTGSPMQKSTIGYLRTPLSAAADNRQPATDRSLRG